MRLRYLPTSSCCLSLAESPSRSRATWSLMHSSCGFLLLALLSTFSR